MDGHGLRETLATGQDIEPSILDDSEYRGISLGLPGLIDRLLWKTFMKVFHRDPESNLLRGWNVRLAQTGPDGAVEPLHDRNGKRRSFGHYLVSSSHTGIMLDYSFGNAAWDPVRLLRDPVVALEPGKADLLFGCSMLELGVGRPRTPSYFLLERIGPLREVVPLRR